MIIIKIEFPTTVGLELKKFGRQQYAIINNNRVTINYDAPCWLGTVSFDDLEAAFEMTQWLLDQGYRVSMRQV